MLGGTVLTILQTMSGMPMLLNIWDMKILPMLISGPTNILIIVLMIMGSEEANIQKN